MQVLAGHRALLPPSRSDAEFLGLAVSGSLAVKPGVKVHARNELRVADKGRLVLQGGVVDSLRWVDVQSGGTLAGHGAEAVRDAIAETISSLPDQLRRSLTWDQGAEMAQHAQLRNDTGLEIYFCDPQSPWQRGSNENTNGLLRQYFPKGTDLSQHGADELSAVAHSLNTRPRKTLGWQTPAEALDRLLKQDMIEGVATTG